MQKKQILIINVAMLAFAGYAHAQPAGTLKNQGYLVDNLGSSAVVKAPTAGVCVRTSEWTPARAIADCDPELAKPAAPKIAAAPAPAP
ncbi:MAG: hypothetical protein ABL891_22280 [Burkholderiales bacterium]